MHKFTNRFLVILPILTVLLHATPALAQTADLPHVLILTTGGTIASRMGAPMASGTNLVEAVPELLDHALVHVEEFSRIGSSQMTPSNWLGLAKRINVAFTDDPDLSGVVVTHGTDTMEETAFFLNLTVRHSRPVVLVGSMRAANEISADGPANLLSAVRVAVSYDAVDAGVLVVLNEDISAARDVWKTDNRRVHTFRSPEFGHLGVVDPDTVLFYRSSTRPHTTQSEFDVTWLDSLPHVGIIADYAGFDGSAIVDLAVRNPDGIVVTTFAGGRMSAGAHSGVQTAVEAGIPVVIASRVPGGRIVGNPVGQLGVVVAHDLTAHKARILLMLALAKSRNLSELQRVFDTY
jgi:L-asparaginase type II